MFISISAFYPRQLSFLSIFVNFQVFKFCKFIFNMFSFCTLYAYLNPINYCYFSVGSSDWVLVNNNVRPSDLVQNGIRFQKFVVLDLIPRTKYILRITAHNSAGSTVKQFTFTTLNSDGTPMASEGQKKDESEMVLPFILVAFTVTSIVLGIALMLCIKKLEVKQSLRY